MLLTFDSFRRSATSVCDLRQHFPDLDPEDYPSPVPGLIYGDDAIRPYVQHLADRGFYLQIGNFELTSFDISEIEPSLYAYYLGECTPEATAEQLAAARATCPPTPTSAIRSNRP